MCSRKRYVSCCLWHNWRIGSYWLCTWARTYSLLGTIEVLLRYFHRFSSLGDLKISIDSVGPGMCNYMRHEQLEKVRTPARNFVAFSTAPAKAEVAPKSVSVTFFSPNQHTHTHSTKILKIWPKALHHPSQIIESGSKRRWDDDQTS